MRHNKNFNHLGRQAGHRKAMSVSYTHLDVYKRQVDGHHDSFLPEDAERG